MHWQTIAMKKITQENLLKVVGNGRVIGFSTIPLRTLQNFLQQILIVESKYQKKKSFARASRSIYLSTTLMSSYLNVLLIIGARPTVAHHQLLNFRRVISIENGSAMIVVISHYGLIVRIMACIA